MIVTYNKEQVGDVLMLTLKNSGDAKLAAERKGKVARVYREDKQETVAWNIFEASTFFALDGKGQIFPRPCPASASAPAPRRCR